MAHKLTPLDYLRKHWLLLGILFCIFLASFYPKLGSTGGLLKPEVTVKYGAVIIIFVISGFSINTASICYTLKQHHLHLFIQIYTFVLIPFFVQILVQFLTIFNINTWLLKGLITVACMPPPVSSAIILTKSAQGNETAAVFNSVLGSLLGIFITPLSLLINLGYTTLVPISYTIFQLTVTVLIPLLLGKIVRNFIPTEGHKLPLGTVGQVALLFIIYTTFCDTFLVPETGLSASDVLITVFIVLQIQIFLLYVTFTIAKHSKKYFTAADVVAVTFCSTHKSLTLEITYVNKASPNNHLSMMFCRIFTMLCYVTCGNNMKHLTKQRFVEHHIKRLLGSRIPILKMMFHGYSHFSQISLPLLVYHPMQIILGGFIVSHLKSWVNHQTDRKLPV